MLENGTEKVDRVLANQTLSSTTSQGTSNIPFAWFLVLGCKRQAKKSIVSAVARNVQGINTVIPRRDQILRRITMLIRRQNYSCKINGLLSRFMELFFYRYSRIPDI